MEVPTFVFSPSGFFFHLAIIWTTHFLQLRSLLHFIYGGSHGCQPGKTANKSVFVHFHHITAEGLVYRKRIFFLRPIQFYRKWSEHCQFHWLSPKILHGGFAYMCWCSKGSGVLELQPPDYSSISNYSGELSNPDMGFSLHTQLMYTIPLPYAKNHTLSPTRHKHLPGFTPTTSSSRALLSSPTGCYGNMK